MKGRIDEGFESHEAEAKETRQELPLQRKGEDDRTPSRNLPLRIKGSHKNPQAASPRMSGAS